MVAKTSTRLDKVIGYLLPCQPDRMLEIKQSKACCMVPESVLATAGFVGEDGNFHPPRWQLREMMVRGMHNLL